MLIALQVNSQTISKGTVKTLVNDKGDTLIVMNVSDAKVILTSVLDKEYSDSIIALYKLNDSTSQQTITLGLKEISDLQQISANKDIEIKNLNLIITNKDSEITLLNKTIKQEKRLIAKQKIMKVIGYAVIVLLGAKILIK